MLVGKFITLILAHAIVLLLWPVPVILYLTRHLVNVNAQVQVKYVLQQWAGTPTVVNVNVLLFNNVIHGKFGILDLAAVIVLVQLHHATVFSNGTQVNAHVTAWHYLSVWEDINLTLQLVDARLQHFHH